MKNKASLYGYNFELGSNGDKIESQEVDNRINEEEIEDQISDESNKDEVESRKFTNEGIDEDHEITTETEEDHASEEEINKERATQDYNGDEPTKDSVEEATMVWAYEAVDVFGVHLGSIESHDQLFRTCEWFKALKLQIQQWCGVLLEDWTVQRLLEVIQKQKGPRLLREFKAGILASLVYHTWQARNAAIFQEKGADVRAHTEQIKLELQARLMLKSTFKAARKFSGLFSVVCC